MKGVITDFNMHAENGTYALVFKTQQTKKIIVGKLGTLKLQPGFYVYVGSAFGPGGLKARIGHHCRRSRRLHWHIDYLSKYLPPIEVWYTYDTFRQEHCWSEILEHYRGSSTPLPGFGSSDCRCISHLHLFSARPSGNYFRRKVHAAIDDHAKVYIKKFLDKI